jgi:hypothetical protein
MGLVAHFTTCSSLGIWFWKRDYGDSILMLVFIPRYMGAKHFRDAGSGKRRQNILFIYILHNVRFEVFMAVTMKNVAFWDVTPCGSCKNRCSGGTYDEGGAKFLRNVSSYKSHAA